MRWETVAEFAFIGGILLALFISAVPGANAYAYTVTIFLGFLVGFINLFDKNLDKFMRAVNTLLLASIVFYILASQVTDPMLASFKSIATGLAFFLAPVAFIVAIKDVYDIAMDYKEEKMAESKKKKKR